MVNNKTGESGSLDVDLMLLPPVEHEGVEAGGGEKARGGRRRGALAYHLKV